MESRKSSLFYDICAALAALGIVFAYHERILSRSSGVILALSGKDIYARSQVIRSLFFAAIFLCIAAGFILLDRLLFRKIKTTRVQRMILVLLHLIPAAQTLIICANQILRRDDYWEIADAHTYGFPGSLIFEVTNHNGRYLSWGIKSTYAFLPPIPYINILLFLNICFLTAGLYLLVRQVMLHAKRERERERERRFSC